MQPLLIAPFIDGALEAEEGSRQRGWNAVLGTSAMLVLVDVVGPIFPIGKPASLTFTATSGSTQLAHKWVSLRYGYGSEKRRTTVPFLVHGVECVTIKISVTLRVAGRHQRRGYEVPLACGE